MSFNVAFARPTSGDDDDDDDVPKGSVRMSTLPDEVVAGAGPLPYDAAAIIVVHEQGCPCCERCAEVCKSFAARRPDIFKYIDKDGTSNTLHQSVDDMTFLNTYYNITGYPRILFKRKGGPMYKWIGPRDVAAFNRLIVYVTLK